MQIVNWNEIPKDSQPSLNKWMLVVYSACLASLSIAGWTIKKSNIINESQFMIPCVSIHHVWGKGKGNTVYCRT